MIQITIGNEQRDVTDADPEWINTQINRRRAAGESVCVRVSIDEGDYKMGLTTPACGGQGRGRTPTAKEAALFALWERMHLNDDTFSGGDVVAFLAQLKRVL